MITNTDHADNLSLFDINHVVFLALWGFDHAVLLCEGLTMQSCLVRVWSQRVCWLSILLLLIYICYHSCDSWEYITQDSTICFSSEIIWLAFGCSHIQVEGYFFVTGNGASACGFGIRSGDDVIRISKCSSSMATRLFLVGDLTPHTKVYQEEEGNKIKVSHAQRSNCTSGELTCSLYRAGFCLCKWKCFVFFFSLREI